MHTMRILARRRPPSALTAELRLPSPCRRWLQKRCSSAAGHTGRRGARRSSSTAGCASVSPRGRSPWHCAGSCCRLRVGHLAVHDRAQRVYRPAHSVWVQFQPGFRFTRPRRLCCLRPSPTACFCRGACLNYLLYNGSGFSRQHGGVSRSPDRLVLVDT